MSKKFLEYFFTNFIIVAINKIISLLFYQLHQNTRRNMKRKLYSTLTLAWMIIVTASAISPAVFHAALKKMYPQATHVDWGEQGNYYTAAFTYNGFLKKVWMNANAQWVMTDTDLETADRLPPLVYNSFIFTQYGSWTVNDVNLIKLPRQPSLYVITVNMDNSISTYQLFYATDGRLVQTRDVSYISPELTPSVIP